MRPLLQPLDETIAEAIAFLQQHEPPEGYFVGFSGGKDSIVTLELCRLAGVKHEAYYSATGIDPPEVVGFIRQHYPEVIWLRPKISFWKGILVNAPPTRRARWCCDLLKKNPTLHIPLKKRVMGTRAEESWRRAQFPRIDRLEKKKYTIYKPIFHWLEWHVWEFIDQRKLQYPILYDEGFDRIGCVICPFIMSPNKKMVLRNKQRWPHLYRVFEKKVAQWYSKHLDRPRRPPGETVDDYLDRYYRGFPKEQQEQTKEEGPFNL